MGVEIKGLDDIEKTLKKKYSPKSIEEAEKRAVKSAGNMMRNKIATDLDSVRDTGELAIGTDITEPEKVGNKIQSKIYWRGEHRTLAAINENGHYDRSGKWVEPRAVGKASRQLTLNKDLYFKIVKKELDR